jgi:hypothetical protein
MLLSKQRKQTDVDRCRDPNTSRGCRSGFGGGDRTSRGANVLVSELVRKETL